MASRTRCTFLFPSIERSGLAHEAKLRLYCGMRTGSCPAHSACATRDHSGGKGSHPWQKCDFLVVNFWQQWRRTIALFIVILANSTNFPPLYMYYTCTCAYARIYRYYCACICAWQGHKRTTSTCKWASRPMIRHAYLSHVNIYPCRNYM